MKSLICEINLLSVDDNFKDARVIESDSGEILFQQADLENEDEGTTHSLSAILFQIKQENPRAFQRVLNQVNNLESLAKISNM